MSMNLYLEGTREIIVVATGKQETQRFMYDLWQTPTTVTRECMASGNPAEAYYKWIRGLNNQEGGSHIRQVKKAVKDAIEDGYTLEWSET